VSIHANSERVVVYTDGACSGNPGPGGWAWAVPEGDYASGPDPHTTNQRMEIRAVLEALRSLSGNDIEVISDSTYVVNCFRDRWYEGWMARGWTNSQRKPVANRDLWEPLIDLVLERRREGRVTFRWVKGHSNDPMNDLVDRLAVEAATTQRAQAGTGRPGLAPAAPAAAGKPGGPGLPAGRPVVVTGLRPPGLGGYEGGPVADAVRSRLGQILAAKRLLHPDLYVVTGLGLGAEQLGAEAAAATGVPYLAVLPYPDPDALWPERSRKHFRALVAGALDTIVLQDRAPTSRQAAAGALARRDAWLARQAAEAIVVWDGKDPGVGRLERSFRDHLGEEEVWVLTPEA
jgi:ribonuclease HI